MRIAVVLLMAILVAACSRGSVKNGADGEFVPSASVEIYQWPPVNFDSTSPQPDWEWPSTLQPIADYQAYTNSSGDSHEGTNWGIDGDAHCVNGVEDGRLDQYEWYRFRVTKAGYEPAYFYKYHDGYTETCTSYICGSGQTNNTYSCKTFDTMNLWEVGDVHQQLPDIFMDTRELRDREFHCATLPNANSSNDTSIHRVGLRVSVGTANVGSGDFHLEGTGYGDGIDGNESLVQVIEKSDGTEDTRYINPASLIDHPDHGHWHFESWNQVRIIQDSSNCQSDPSTRDPSCELVEGQKTSFCAVDYEDFDKEIFNRFKDANDGEFACESAVQGISTGKKDVYKKHLPGQLVDLGSPPNQPGDTGSMPTAGSYTLESHFDPDDAFAGWERDRSNNIGRVPLQIPGFTTSSSSNPNCDEIVDCRYWQVMSPSDPDRITCRDLLKCDSDSDCINGLTCQQDPDHPNESDSKLCQTP